MYIYSLWHDIGLGEKANGRMYNFSKSKTISDYI